MLELAGEGRCSDGTCFVCAHAAVLWGTKAYNASRRPASVIVSVSDLAWPWQPSPRHPPPTMGGDVTGAISFGLAVSVEELSRLTAMICSGIPGEIQCRPIWAAEGANGFSLSVMSHDVQYSQTFHRTYEGLAVDHAYFRLPEDSRARGFAKRLVRNLVIAYDELGVRHVDIFAGLENGGYTWAKLGARAKDPALQLECLKDRLSKSIEAGRIPRAYEQLIIDELSVASGADLMYRAATLRTEDGGGFDFGKELLVGHSWEGYWDLRDSTLRAHLRETVR